MLKPWRLIESCKVEILNLGVNSVFVVFSAIPYLGFMASISGVITNLRLLKSKWVAVIAFYSVVNVGLASAASLIYGDTVDGLQNLARASIQIIAGSLSYKQMIATSPTLTILFIFVNQILIYTVFVRSFLLIFMASCEEYTSFFEKSQSSIAGIIDKSLKRIAGNFSDSNAVFKRISIGIRYLRGLLSAENMGRDTNMKGSGTEDVAAEVSQNIRNMVSKMDQEIITLTLSEGSRFPTNQTLQLLVEEMQKSSTPKRATTTKKAEEEASNTQSAPAWTETFLQQVNSTHPDFGERLRNSVIHRTNHKLYTHFIREKVLKTVEDFFYSQGLQPELSPLKLCESAVTKLPAAFDKISNARRATINAQTFRDKMPEGPSDDAGPGFDQNQENKQQLDADPAETHRGLSLEDEQFDYEKTMLAPELQTQAKLWMWAVLASTAASSQAKKKIFRSGSRSSQGSPKKSKTTIVLTDFERILHPLKTLTISDILHNMSHEHLIPLRRLWLRLESKLKQEIWCAAGELELSLSARMMILAAVGYSVIIDDFEITQSQGDEVVDRVPRNATNKASFDKNSALKKKTNRVLNTLQGLAQFSNLTDLVDYISKESKLGSKRTLRTFESFILKQQDLLPEEMKYTFLFQINNQTGSVWRNTVYSPLLPTSPVKSLEATHRQLFTDTKPDSEVLITEGLYSLAPRSAFWLRLGSMPSDTIGRYNYIEGRFDLTQPTLTSLVSSTCTYCSRSH